MANKNHRPKKPSKAQRKAGRAKRSAAASNNAETPMSKSGFVRSMPTAPTKEIMRLYKEQYGEEITAGLIYNVRNSLKHEAVPGKEPSKIAASSRPSGTPVGSAVARRRSKVTPVVGSTDRVDPNVVTQFRTSVLRMGLDRAEALFREFRHSLGVDLETPSPRPKALRRAAQTAGGPRALQLAGGAVQPSGEAATPG